MFALSGYWFSKVGFDKRQNYENEDLMVLDIAAFDSY